MPAAGWAAKSGNPLLWVTATGRPAGDRGRAQDPQVGRRSTCSGPADAVPDAVFDALGKLGTVKRIAGTDAVTNAITFARYQRRRRSAGTSSIPGHGLVFANARRPQDAAAAAPLSASRHVRAAAAAHRRRRAAGAAAGLPARHPARLRRADRSGPRRLQPWLDHRRRERHRGRRPGPHRYALGDPASRHRSDQSDMAEAEQPERLRGGREVTVDDVRQLVASATPHFAYQIRNRIQKLVAGLPADTPVRLLRRRGDRQARAARLHRRGPRHARAARHGRARRA